MQTNSNTAETAERIAELEDAAIRFGDMAAKMGEPEDESGKWTRLAITALNRAADLRAELTQ